MKVLSWWIENGITHVCYLDDDGNEKVEPKRKFAEHLGCLESVCEIYLSLDKKWDKAKDKTR